MQTWPGSVTFGIHIDAMRYWKVVGLIALICVGLGGFGYYLTHDAEAADARLEHGIPTNPDYLDPPALDGIDLTRMALSTMEATASASNGRTAHLSIDPGLQRKVLELFVSRGVTEGSVVLVDLRSSRLLVYASINEGPRRDVNVEAKAPAASVFKVVTGTALVDKAGLSIDHKQCYQGGQHGFELSDLIEDEVRDKWCATLAGAMGRSLNVVMGRLALRYLDPESLGSVAKAYGFGSPVSFDVPVQPSIVVLAEDDDLEFARTAAVFWNTTLSPVQGAMIASIVAQKGAVMRPVLVNSVTDARGKVIYRAPAAPQKLGQAFSPEVAGAVRRMMRETFLNGTAHSDFFDAKGRPYLPDVKLLAGKTGSLTSKTQRYYTWLVGFAGSEEPEVAFAVLVNNGPKWRTKAPLLTREVLRAYFAAHGVSGAT